jgi:hypothetical protein
MTILWCGGEDVDFEDIVYVEDGHCVSANARCALNILNAPIPYAKSYAFTDVTSCWCSYMFYCNTFASTNALMLGLSKKGSNAWIGMGCGSIAKKAALFKYDGTTITKLSEETGTSVIDSFILNKVDIQIINYGVNGTINLFINGALVTTYTGDLTVLSNASLNIVHLVRTASSTAGFVSEVIVADEDTRLMRLKTHAPDAAGDSSTNWTGAYTGIDEVASTDTDKIYSSTNDADFQCNLSGMPPGAYRVKAVKAVVRAVDGSGSMGVALGVKTGGTVDVGSTETCSGYWQSKERLMTVNPVTGVEWTPAEVEALQLNIRAKTI